MSAYPPRNASRETGSMLLEAMFGILIFSMGILALVGLQATSIKQSTDGKYRSDAGLLANELIGQMWVSNRTPAVLQANFQGPSGAAYLAWWGDATTPADGTVRKSLPGGLAPAVVVAPQGAGLTATSLVTITLSWQPPNGEVHNYVVKAQIK